jgi:hypothetical protein
LGRHPDLGFRAAPPFLLISAPQVGKQARFSKLNWLKFEATFAAIRDELAAWKRALPDRLAELSAR